MISCRESGRWTVHTVLVFWSYVGRIDNYGCCRSPYLEHFAFVHGLVISITILQWCPIDIPDKRKIGDRVFMVVCVECNEIYSYVGSCNAEKEILCFVDRASRYFRVTKTNSMHCLSAVYFVSQLLHVSGMFVAHHQKVYSISDKSVPLHARGAQRVPGS